MPDAITWQQIGVLATVLAGFAALVKWVLAQFSRRDEALTLAQKAAFDAVSSVQKELNQHKIDTERDKASGSDLTALELRLVSAISAMRDDFRVAVSGMATDFREMTKRLNTVLDFLAVRNVDQK